MRPFVTFAEVCSGGKEDFLRMADCSLCGWNVGQPSQDERATSISSSFVGGNTPNFGTSG